MLYDALFSVMGLGALIVALTKVFKKLVGNAEWYKKAIADGKKWPGHLLAFIASILCVGGVVAVGLIWNVGIFSAFCVACFSSWLNAVALVLLFTGFANGMWSYEFIKKVLDWLQLMPKNSAKSDKPANQEESVH
jgi:hypothetical protein